MITYADSSFLFSLYVLDSHSANAIATVKRTTLPLRISDFCEFELTNAICWRVVLKSLRPSQVDNALDHFAQDVRAGALHVVPIPGSAFQRAKQLARANTPTIGCRALDVLHVATALSFKAQVFYTFDMRQAKLASSCGLKLRQ